MVKKLIAFTVVALMASSAIAQNIKLSNAVFKETEIKTATGKIERKLVPADVVTPGDRIVFVMGYSNAGDKPAEKVVITNPVPAQVTYLGGVNDNEPIVSVDGGKFFAALTALTTKNADGTTRAARASDVTHVRWLIARALTSGETGKVSYRGQLK
jgi:uncharacterized repeat protein (TIGR01451 family)